MVIITPVATKDKGTPVFKKSFVDKKGVPNSSVTLIAAILGNPDTDGVRR